MTDGCVPPAIDDEKINWSTVTPPATFESLKAVWRTIQEGACKRRSALPQHVMAAPQACDAYVDDFVEQTLPLRNASRTCVRALPKGVGGAPGDLVVVLRRRGSRYHARVPLPFGAAGAPFGADLAQAARSRGSAVVSLVEVTLAVTDDSRPVDAVVLVLWTRAAALADAVTLQALRGAARQTLAHALLFAGVDRRSAVAVRFVGDVLPDDRLSTDVPLSARVIIRHSGARAADHRRAPLRSVRVALLSLSPSVAMLPLVREPLTLRVRRDDADSYAMTLWLPSDYPDTPFARALQRQVVGEGAMAPLVDGGLEVQSRDEVHDESLRSFPSATGERHVSLEWWRSNARGELRPLLHTDEERALAGWGRRALCATLRLLNECFDERLDEHRTLVVLSAVSDFDMDAEPDERRRRDRLRDELADATDPNDRDTMQERMLAIEEAVQRRLERYYERVYGFQPTNERLFSNYWQHMAAPLDTVLRHCGAAAAES